MRPGQAAALRRRILRAPSEWRRKTQNEEEVIVVLKDLQQVKKVKALCRRKALEQRKGVEVKKRILTTASGMQGRKEK